MNPGNEKLLLTISRIRDLTPRIRAYELRAMSGDELPLVTAGSHIAIPVLLNGKTVFRNYSICSNPGERHFYEIVVLLDEKSHSGSTYIFNYYEVGTTLACDYPDNNFHLHADASPSVLFASDIGIAPIRSIAHTLASRGRRFALHYVGRSKTDMAFIAELDHSFPRNVYLYPADEDKHLDIMNALADAPGNALFYACGPQKMLEDIETSSRLLGIHKDRLQLESFEDNSASNRPLVLELAYSNKLIHVNPDQPLLNAVRDAGVEVNFDCCVGDCGSCAVKILTGEADHRDHVLSDAQKAEGFICLCVSRAKGDKLVLAL